MTSTTEPTVLQERNVPAAICSLSTLATLDYIDLFTVTSSEAARWSPEQWAHGVVEDAAGVGGQFVWRVLLGLTLERQPSPDRVGGWKIAGRGDDWIRLESASWFLTAQIAVQVDDGQVSVATFIRYDRRIAALMWPPLSIVHRRAMPALLRQAVRAQQAKPMRTVPPTSVRGAT
jgi:hypothetical protein